MVSEKCNCQCCVIWRKYEKRWKDKIAKLEASNDKLQSAYNDACVQICDLEFELYEYRKQDAKACDLINTELNNIKAEGIREMVMNLKQSGDIINESIGIRIAEGAIFRYADKLESEDE